MEDLYTKDLIRCSCSTRNRLNDARKDSCALGTPGSSCLFERVQGWHEVGQWNRLLCAFI